MKALIWLLAFQCGVALLYGLAAKKKKQPLPLEKIAITALIPMMGLFMPYLGLIFKNKEVEVLSDTFDREEYRFRHDIRYLKKAEIEKEINTVPVEEALILNDSVTKRRLIMDTAKENAYDYITFLKLAIRDQDMETSHYAASLVMEIKRNLQNLIQSLSVAHGHDPDNLIVLEEYIQVVSKYYRSQLLDEKNQERYAYLYSQLLDAYLTKTTPSEHWLEEKIDVDFHLGHLKEIETWINVYYQSYPDSERPYLLLLKHYYHNGDQAKFDITLKALKGSHIKLSREGLSIVRYWSDWSV